MQFSYIHMYSIPGKQFDNAGKNCFFLNFPFMVFERLRSFFAVLRRFWPLRALVQDTHFFLPGVMYRIFQNFVKINFFLFKNIY